MRQCPFFFFFTRRALPTVGRPSAAQCQRRAGATEACTYPRRASGTFSPSEVELRITQGPPHFKEEGLSTAVRQLPSEERLGHCPTGRSPAPYSRGRLRYLHMTKHRRNKQAYKPPLPFIWLSSSRLSFGNGGPHLKPGIGDDLSLCCGKLLGRRLHPDGQDIGSL